MNMDIIRRVAAVLLLGVSIVSFTLYQKSESEAAGVSAAEQVRFGKYCAHSQEHHMWGGEPSKEGLSYQSPLNGLDQMLHNSKKEGGGNIAENNAQCLSWQNCDPLSSKIVGGSTYLGEVQLIDTCSDAESASKDRKEVENSHVKLPEGMFCWISEQHPKAGDVVSVRFHNNKLYSFRVVDVYEQENGECSLSGNFINEEGWVSLIYSEGEVKMQIYDKDYSSLYNVFYMPQDGVYNVRTLRLSEVENCFAAE